MMELCIIIEIKICGLINVDECFVCDYRNLVIPINPLGVRHPIEQCGMFTSHFYIFLDADNTLEDQQVGIWRTLECP